MQYNWINGSFSPFSKNPPVDFSDDVQLFGETADKAGYQRLFGVGEGPCEIELYVSGQNLNPASGYLYLALITFGAKRTEVVWLKNFPDALMFLANYSGLANLGPNRTR